MVVYLRDCSRWAEQGKYSLLVINRSFVELLPYPVLFTSLIYFSYRCTRCSFIVDDFENVYNSRYLSPSYQIDTCSQ